MAACCKILFKKRNYEIDKIWRILLGRWLRYLSWQCGRDQHNYCILSLFMPDSLNSTIIPSQRSAIYKYILNYCFVLQLAGNLLNICFVDTWFINYHMTCKVMKNRHYLPLQYNSEIFRSIVYVIAIYSKPLSPIQENRFPRGTLIFDLTRSLISPLSRVIIWEFTFVYVPMFTGSYLMAYLDLRNEIYMLYITMLPLISLGTVDMFLSDLPFHQALLHTSVEEYFCDVKKCDM